MSESTTRNRQIVTIQSSIPITAGICINPTPLSSRPIPFTLENNHNHPFIIIMIISFIIINYVNLRNAFHSTIITIVSDKWALHPEGW